LAIEPYNRTIQQKLRALGSAANASSSSAPAAPDPHAGMRGSPHGEPPPAPVGVQAGAVTSENDYERGNFLARTGRREEAVAAYREAVRKEPGNIAAWNNLGCALGELGRRTEAAAAFEETLRLKPDHASALSNLELLRTAR
jgi:tetratricopeptide (TPR) repeat protein